PTEVGESLDHQPACRIGEEHRARLEVGHEVDAPLALPRVGDRGHAEVELSRRDAGKDRAEARAYDLHLEAHDGGQRLCQVGIHANYRLPVVTDDLVGRVMRFGGDDQYALRLDCSWTFRCDLGVDAGRNGCRRVRGCGRARALLAATAAPGREGGDR